MPQPNPLDLYRVMLLARLLDERMWQLIRQGKGHFAVPSSGHESSIAIAFALDQSRDYLVPHYRDLATLLAWGVTPREVLSHFFGKANDPFSGGRQMFAHWGHKRLRILSLSSPQPNQVTHAVGVALAAKYRGEKYVTWCGFGDGSSSTGDVHESMNFAAIHKLPLVFCCENNQYAISVPQHLQMAVENVADRAAGYGMPGVVIDGSDPLAMYEASKKAVDRARSGEGPTLIEMKCYRYYSHTSNDDDRRYRPREEVEAARKKDPLVVFKQKLTKEKKWSAEKEEALTQELTERVDDAVTFAENSPDPKAEDLHRHVYANESD